MAAVNKVFLMGNLTREPEVRQLPSGSLVCDFGLAVNRRFTNNRGESQEETCFVDVSIFGRIADVVRTYCHKGDPLFVEGRLRYDQWDDKVTGQRRSRLTVVGDSIELLRGRTDGSGQGGAMAGGNGGYAPQPRQQFGGAPAYQGNGMGTAPVQQPQYQPRPQYSAPVSQPMPQQPTGYGTPAAPVPPPPMPAMPAATQVPPMPSFQNSPDDGGSAPIAGDAPVDDVPF